MQPLELIDQMLAKPEFSCTKKQMEFLRDLVVRHQDPKTLQKAIANRKKIEVANAKREVTHTRKMFEAAQANLKLVEGR